jgi:UDP-N-acetylmuramate--alanine ligase
VTDWSGRRLHFVGIGGAGMSGLALVARTLGASVTGSDRAESSYMGPLRAAGIEPAIGHDAANVPDGAEVVVSTAIAPDNPELGAGSPVLHRADLLGELTLLKPALAIAGTHGKTTSTCMAVHVLIETGRRPAYVIGGELRTTGLNAAWDDGDWLVVEADESDGSFMKLAPRVVVITNVELDHLETYHSELEIERAFADFAAKAETTVAAGALEAADVELSPIGSRFTVEGVAVELRVPGELNIRNALTALAACRAVGVGLEEAAPALASFAGAGRRFEAHGRTPSGASVYDDYAHHPTEVRATLEAARTLGPERVVACFQPHLYTRTRAFAREFGQALALADVTCVLDVYPARERAEDHPGVTGWLVAAAVADHAGGRPVYWTPGMDDAERMLEGELGEGDLVLTLGAGDVDRLAERLTAA